MIVIAKLSVAMNKGSSEFGFTVKRSQSRSHITNKYLCPSLVVSLSLILIKPQNQDFRWR